MTAEHDDWRSKLSERFPQGQNSLDEWQKLRAQLSVGSLVRGEVVARAHFGVWVDLDLGFPALLEVIDFADAERRRYSFAEYPAEGSLLTAKVTHFHDDSRQIYLSQR